MQTSTVTHRGTSCALHDSVTNRGSRPSGQNRFVVRRVKPAPAIAEVTGFEEDNARTVVRTPAPTLPPDTSQKFAAQKPGNDSFVAAPGKTIGKFVLGEKMAQGTFGVV